MLLEVIARMRWKPIRAQNAAQIQSSRHFKFKPIRPLPQVPFKTLFLHSEQISQRNPLTVNFISLSLSLSRHSLRVMEPQTKRPLQSSSAANVAAAGGRTIEEVYQKKTQLEHILLRPDTYVGSIEKHTQTLWVYENDEMVQRPVSYVPGLYKIFDEILVNAADNKQRDPSMDALKVTIDPEQNTVSVLNNGDGVPVEIHQEEKVYVPELIFGHLLTSSNYDDNVKKTTGGRNGYGAKLTNIFSTEFVIETADGKRQKKYKQVFFSALQVSLHFP